jgi:hypothetical protein
MMILALFAMLTVLFAALVLYNLRAATWRKQMRQTPARRETRWTAPEAVVNSVIDHYLDSQRWLESHIVQHWSQQWLHGSTYFAGDFLKRYQQILTGYRAGRTPRFIGVLRAEHEVEVRTFSDDGTRCLLIDHQRQRWMLTHDTRTGQTHNELRLDDAAVVYQMVYSSDSRRWKVESLIQELPGRIQHTNLYLNVSEPIGRDN